MTYTVISPNLAGLTPIASIDAGSANANGATLYPSLPMHEGMRVQAQDPTYGMGEFILLNGVASTTVGSLVTYDGTTYATTLAAVTANQGRPVAIAMSANTDPLKWGWYQIAGTAVVAKSTGITFAATVALGVNSTGKVGASASGKQILGARTANAATVASATTTVNVVLDRPHLQGRVS